jgi:hypothetical protein
MVTKSRQACESSTHRMIKSATETTRVLRLATAIHRLVPRCMLQMKVFLDNVNDCAKSACVDQTNGHTDTTSYRAAQSIDVSRDRTMSARSRLVPSTCTSLRTDGLRKPKVDCHLNAARIPALLKNFFLRVELWSRDCLPPRSSMTPLDRTALYDPAEAW